ncbi:O-antigen ligase family protein [Loktanella sp. S4079]|uniref:O-antigen ligase family protein n=1 Tax=Loktanella sp. S4079 TaxID=579483 RepID=UPI000B2C89FC|nr:O-antigen ligase [Loktanella sp. S4079]
MTGTYPTAPAVRLPARPVEKLLTVMWFVVTFTVFPRDELILYPLALYFFYAFFRQAHTTLPILLRCWPLMLLPVWAMVTSATAVLPSVAFRTAIQMILTMQVCILLVVWMRPREILLTVLAATGICGILSVFFTSYHDGAMTGIFAHKNMLGAKMLLLWLSSLCVALDPWMRLWVRSIALGLAALALMLIVASHSATALVLAVLIAVMIVIFSFFAGRGSRTPMDRFALGLILCGILGVAIPFAISASSETPLALLLQRLGKSSTLTGRTELWGYAEDVIRQRPWTGHGSGGFWRYEENDLVRQIFAEFHKSPNQVFSFHNSYFEITVHFGLVGLALAIFVLCWAFVRLIAQLLRRGGMPFVFFTCVAVVELARSMVESELMRPFILGQMLIWIGTIYVSRYPLRQKRIHAS